MLDLRIGRRGYDGQLGLMAFARSRIAPASKTLSLSPILA
jgi:hypothetical protein